MRLWVSFLAMLAFAVGFISCNTDDDDNDGIPKPEVFFVSFEIDTLNVLYEDGEEFYGNAIGIDWYPDSLGILYRQSTSFQRANFVSDYENDALRVEVVKYYQDSLPPTLSESFQLFEIGSKPFGTWSAVSTNLGIDGVLISYTDSTGKVWTTGEQESWSSFEVTDHTAVEGKPYAGETKGTFDCRVYDGLGGQLDLRNGNFYARTIYKPE